MWLEKLPFTLAELYSGQWTPRQSGAVLLCSWIVTRGLVQGTGTTKLMCLIHPVAPFIGHRGQTIKKG